jgi:hypothetical protein
MVHPADEQPAAAQIPQTITDSLEVCQEKSNAIKRRVKCSSRTLMLLGVIGLFASMGLAYHARDAAGRVVQGKRAFGPPDDEPPAWDDDEAWEAKEQERAAFGA